jgi:hypothetical protein
LLIVSVPKEKTKEIGCRFYEANESACRRVDKSGLCQRFTKAFRAGIARRIFAQNLFQSGGRASSIENTLKKLPGRQLSTKLTLLVDTSVNFS